MLLKKLLAPFTTPPSSAELPDAGSCGGPLVLPEENQNQFYPDMHSGCLDSLLAKCEKHRRQTRAWGEI